MLPGQQHHPAHDVRIAGVEAGRDVGRADQRHELFVDTIADGPRTEAFAHVGIQIDQRLLHVSQPLFRWHRRKPAMQDGAKISEQPKG
jgi:hypothetical protein